jgi:hypothetical protein
MKEQMMTDRRRDQRCQIDLLVNKYLGDDPHICRAVNISRRGMLLYKVFEPDVPMDRVTIEFQLPGSDHVLRASGMTLAEDMCARAHAVRFTTLSEEDARRIELWLRSPKSEAAMG